MEFFTWKESFAIGIRDVDRQHRAFLEMLNECHREALASGHQEVGPRLMEQLREYAATHFHDEEELMEFKSYPDLESQRRQHRYFASLLGDLEKGRLEGHAADRAGMMAFLRDWFLNHILVEDRKIAAWI